ncbi:MAG TPA: chemotaxis protein CheD [Candidatus Goldiibacteriota bacterium]|nr:chemotaxis protein CheD [Candidatus Goldiibacteriota bacterium]
MGAIKTAGMGELKIGGNGDTLAAYGIGSCLVVICRDKSRPVAGILHAMLPEKPAKKAEAAKYVDSGIDALVKEMIGLGTGIGALEAKIFGGARMFDTKQEGETIGERNIRKAREVLQKMGIRITGDDTGSTYGRNIEYSVDENRAVVRSFMSGTKII